MFRSPSSRSASSSPQQGSALKRTFKKSFSGSISSKPITSEAATANESPIALLRVQVIGCRDLPAADLNGKSDPYVVLTFGNQRVKTPVIKKNLNPKYTANEATFDLPVFASVIEARGALIDLVVWDKDFVGKDYLAELSLSPSQWFKRKNSPSEASVYAFDDAGNNPLSFTLTNNKPRKSRSTPTTSQPSIQLKIGLVPLDSQSQDLRAVYDEIIAKASLATDKLFTAPPTQAVGSLRTTPTKQSTMGGQTAKDGAKSKESFRINWDGTYVDYDFSTKKSVAGIILLEVQGAKELPKVKNITRTGFDMDPFIVIKYNDELYRTKVIRHDLNPTFNDRFILFVRRSGTLSHSTASMPGVDSSTVILSVLDWEQMSKDKHVGNAIINLQTLIDAAPKPDPETGLYSVEAMRLHNFSEMQLEVGLTQKEKWEGKGPAPTVLIKAKYDPNAAMRQRYWRSSLKDLDKDHSGQLSHADISKALEETGLDVSPEQVNQFFTDQHKDPTSDELTIEEAMIGLEKEYGIAAQVRAEEEAAVTAEVTEEEDAGNTTQELETPATSSDVPADPEHPSEPTSPTRPKARPARSSMFGHSRESIYDLEMQLRTIFQQHEQAHYQSDEDKEIGEAVVPASALPSILTTFSEIYEVDLLGSNDQATLQALVDTMAEAYIGPDFLITFLAKATGTDDSVIVEESEPTVTTPIATSPKSPGEGLSDQADDEDDQRGRSETSSPHHSRTSSRDSVVTSYQLAPETPKATSIFDIRARSTPLEAMAPPSSWSARPQPASRRRKSSSSSIGSRGQSDSEEPSKPAFGRPRAPSNPVTPARLPPFTFPPNNGSDPSSPDESPLARARPPSRPPSQSGFRSLRLGSNGSVSNPTLPFGNTRGQSASPERIDSSAGPSLESSRYDTLSGDDDEVDYHDRLSSDQTSMFSVNTSDRIDELERIREEQTKKLKEVQRTLEDKMATHELEMEEMLVQKEELEAELASSKRDEKELRLKDVNASRQLTALESEVSRLQKELDTSRASYQNLQKLYQEQCNEAEKYRDTLRRKDMELKDSERYVTILSGDVDKWQAQSEATQELVASLTKELTAARDTLDSLDQQKQENLSLKETIDRLRFEMDELRNSKADGPGSTGVSRAGTFVPSLAAEMQRRLLDHADADREDGGDTSRDEEQDEDYVETVITRRKLGKKPRTPPNNGAVRVQDMFRDYTDASTQHDIHEFTTESSTQTLDSDDAASEQATSSAPGPSHSHVIPTEAPPSYARLVEEERERTIDPAAELAKWHPGREHTDAIPEGVSSDVLEEWKRVKGELGFSCLAIDEVLEKSHVHGPRPSSSDAAASPEAVPEAAVVEDKVPDVIEKPSGPYGYSRLTKWTILGLVGAVCLFSFVSGFGIASLLRNRGPRVDRRLWDVVNDVAKAGSFPDLLHRHPHMPWSTIKNVQEQLMRPNWEPI